MHGYNHRGAAAVAAAAAEEAACYVVRSDVTYYEKRIQ